MKISILCHVSFENGPISMLVICKGISVHRESEVFNTLSLHPHHDPTKLYPTNFLQKMFLWP